MQRVLCSLVVLAAALSAQSPAVLHLTAQSNGSSTISAAPGATVSYEIVGVLSNANNEGLALFSFDLSFSGGPLAPAATPTTAPLNGFASPLGLSNPAGFGGTVQGGVLRQVGGGQNTINNFFAPAPNGTVTTGLAQPGTPLVLATGSLTLPNAFGTYTLNISNVFANVIRQGETGLPVWRVDAAEAGSLTSLAIGVQSLSANVPSVSISGLGTQNFSLDLGPSFAGRFYWILGSISGTAPGYLFTPALLIPLNYDWYFTVTLSYPNSTILVNTLDFLDAQGQASASFVMPPGIPAALAGLTLHHAAVIFLPLDTVTNPVSCLLTL